MAMEIDLRVRADQEKTPPFEQSRLYQYWLTGVMSGLLDTPEQITGMLIFTRRMYERIVYGHQDRDIEW